MNCLADLFSLSVEIRVLLERDDQTFSSEMCKLAADFSEQCQLFQKMALNTATSDNVSILSVIEVITSFTHLYFNGFEDWQNLCRIYSLPVPEKFDSSLILKLKSLADSPQNVQLLRKLLEGIESDELLKLAVLRKIFQLEGSTSSITADLLGLENCYVSSQISLIDNCIENNDLVKASILYKEMTASICLSHPSKQWGKRVENILGLENDLDFNEALKIGERKEFLELLTRFKQALKESVKFTKISAIYRQLISFDFMVPEQLEATFSALQTEYKLKRKRRFVLALCTLIFSALVVLIGLGIFIAEQNFQSKCEFWAQEISLTIKNEDLEKGAILIDELENSNRRVFNSPKIQSLIADYTVLNKELSRETEKFNDLVNKLKKFSKPEDILSDQYGRILLEAGKFARTNEEKELLRKLEESFLAAKEERVKRVNEKFLSQWAILDEIYKKFFTLEVEENLPLIEKLAANFEKNYRVANLVEVPTSLYMRRKPLLEERYEKITKTAEERKARIKQKTAMINKFPLLYNRPEQYLELLKKFVEKFPLDPRSKDFSLLINYLPLFKAGKALDSFNPDYINIDKLKKYELQIGELKNNIWKTDATCFLERTKKILSNITDIRKQLQQVSSLEAMRVYEVALRVENDTVYYYSDKLPVREFSKIDSKKLYRLKIMAKRENGKYESIQLNQKPDGSYDLYTYGENRWQRRFKSVRPVEERGGFITAHTKFWQEFISGLGLVKDCKVDDYILEKLAEVQRNRNLNLMIKMELIRLLAEKLQQISDNENARVFERVTVMIDQFVTLRFAQGADWRWLKPADKLAIGAKLSELPNFSFFRKKQAFCCELRRRALGRKVNIVGWYDNGKVRLSKMMQPRELWSLMYKKGEICFVQVAEVRGEKFTFFEGLRSTLLNGQPLLAPLGGSKTTRELASYFKKWAEGEDIIIEWPKSWPVNCR